MKQEISTIIDNTIERNCSKCIYNETCKYIDSFRLAVEDIINTLKSISLPISIDITCNHRKCSVDTITHDDVISALEFCIQYNTPADCDSCKFKLGCIPELIKCSVDTIYDLVLQCKKYNSGDYKLNNANNTGVNMLDMDDLK